MKKIFQIIGFLLLLLMSKTTLAQNSGHLPDSATTIKLAKELSVSKAKALEIQQAYGAYSTEMELVLKNSKLNLRDRERQLRYYQNLRRRRINEVLSAEQKALLQRYRTTDLQDEAERRKQLEIRHQQEIDRVPHELGASKAKGSSNIRKSN